MSWVVYPWGSMQVGETTEVIGRTISEANRARWHAYRSRIGQGKRFKCKTKYNPQGYASGVVITRVK